MVLGRVFLVLAETQTTEGQRLEPTGTARLVVPLHHVQSTVDPRNPVVIHLRIWSSKPVPFATYAQSAVSGLCDALCIVSDTCSPSLCFPSRDASSVDGDTSDYSVCVWQMSLVLDTRDFCAHLHNHINR